MQEKLGEDFMIKRLLALPLVLAIAVCVCSTPALAEGIKKSEPITPSEVRETSIKEVTRAGPKLKTDMERLLTDARAGKVAPRGQQFPPTAKNNLSKTTKIAIVASAAAAAIILGVVFHQLSKD